MTRSTSSTEMLRWVSHAFISLTNDPNARTPLIRPRTGWWTSGSPANDSTSASNSPANRPSKNGTSTSSCCHFSCSRCSTGTENSSGSHGIQQASHNPPRRARAHCRWHLEDTASRSRLDGALIVDHLTHRYAIVDEPPANAQRERRQSGSASSQAGYSPPSSPAAFGETQDAAPRLEGRVLAGKGATSSTSCVCCSCDRSRTRSGRARDPRGRLGPRMRSGLVSIWCDSLLGPAGRSSVASDPRPEQNGARHA